MATTWLIRIACGLCIAALAACGGSVSNTGTEGGGLDFGRSEIITNGAAIADGTSEMIVLIHLMNSDSTAVPLIKPAYQIVQGAGVIANDCTTSNINGISICILKATQPGQKRMAVTNLPIALSRDLTFTTVASSMSMIGLSPTSKTQASASGYKVSASVNSTQPGILKTSLSGWKVYGGPETNSLSP